MVKVRIRHGEDEIEVDGSEASVKKQLDAFYQRVQRTTTPVTLKKDIQAAAAKKASGKELTPAEFYKFKNRTDGVSNILIFGKYLEEQRGETEFSQQEINKVAAEAKLSKNIHPQYFTRAVKQGLLRSLGKGKYSLTLSAEDVLAAMR
jgi:hypothetical protein